MSRIFRGAVILLAVTALCAGGAGAAPAAGVLTLATTTSTENSGLLAHIHPHFEASTGIEVRVIAKGTGASLQLARDGNADVVLVHAREQEDAFVADGHGVMRRDVMYNDFVVLGPRSDPAGAQEAEGAAGALERIARRGCVFVSRGDASGTHVKEQALWRLTDLPLATKTATMVSGGKTVQVTTVRPRGDWYLSVGQGMGKTILLTTEKRAYTLSDRGTYYSFALADPPRTNLVVVCEGDPSLHNPYGVIAVNPEKHPGVNFEGAKRYIEWITSAQVQQMIGSYRVGGKVLFHPGAGGAEAR